MRTSWSIQQPWANYADLVGDVICGACGGGELFKFIGCCVIDVLGRRQGNASQNQSGEYATLSSFVTALTSVSQGPHSGRRFVQLTQADHGLLLREPEQLRHGSSVVGEPVKEVMARANVVSVLHHNRGPLRSADHLYLIFV